RPELRHPRPAGRHPERISVVGAALRDARLAPRVEELHDVCATAERRDWKAAADDLAHRGEVRRDAIQLLRSTGGNAQRDDLVEDKEHPELVGDAAHPLYELWRRGDHTACSDDRLHDHGRDVARLLTKNALGR